MISNKHVPAYILEPSLKEQLIVRCFKVMCRDGYSQTKHFEMRAKLHEELKIQYPSENHEALFSTANDVIAHSRNRWEPWHNNGGVNELVSGLPDSLSEVMANAWKRVAAEKRYKTEQLCAVVRALMFDGRQAAERKSIEIAKEATAVVDSSFLTKGEKEEVKKTSERLFGDATTIVCNAIKHGKSLDLAIYPLDKATESLVRYVGEAALLIQSGRSDELKAGITKKAERFKKWEGRELVAQMLITGIPNIGCENARQYGADLDLNLNTKSIDNANPFIE